MGSDGDYRRLSRIFTPTRQGDDAAEGHAQPRRQGIKILVDGPQHGVGSEKDGGEQQHIDRPAARVLKLLPLYQGKCLIGCRDGGLLQLLDVAECPLSRRWRCAAGEFKQDQRMAQHLVRRQQRLK